MLNLKNTIFVLFIITGLFVSTASAQFSIPGYQSVPNIPGIPGIPGMPGGFDPSDIIQMDNVGLQLSPIYPGPFQTVTLQALTVDFNIRAADITWLLDGQAAQQGRGLNTFSFKTGDVGTESTVVIRAKNPKGKTIEAKKVIRPAGVDILWQAESYTPPFYRGKGLYVDNGFISIVAMPNMKTKAGKKYRSEELVYKWTINGKISEDLSGYGQHTAILEDPSFTNETLIVNVDVTDIEGNLHAAGDLGLIGVSPKIVFYEHDSLLGTKFQNALGNEYNIKSDETNIVAVPYFMGSRNKIVPFLEYKWRMNGLAFDPTDKENKSVLTVRRPENGLKGSSVISLDIQNMANLINSVTGAITVRF